VSENLIAVSISHHRAPIEVRERLQLTEEETRALISDLRQRDLVEALVLSTCNRTEIYALPADSQSVMSIGESLIEIVMSKKGLLPHETEIHKSYFDKLHSREAIEHLFAVIAGIDSQIVGDQQIFAQVKDAFRISSEAGGSGSFLGKLGQAAFRVAKRVITETSLTEGAATISYAAVEFARKIYDDLKSRHILIIGAGESGELAAKHFVERNAGRITVANRSIEKAKEMLARISNEDVSDAYDCIPLDDIESSLSNADIIVSATSAPGYIITEPMMKAAMQKRGSSSPLVIIDIAVPRDIDPEIAKLSNVFLKDIDDLRTIVDRNTERRRKEIPKAEAIIAEEVNAFLESLSKLEAGPTIKELREKFESVRAEELERNRTKLDDRSFALIDDMTRRMMNRLLHGPTISLKETNGESITNIEIVRKMFALDKDEDND
jgi:glutamyl-tRNA reductase